MPRQACDYKHDTLWVPHPLEEKKIFNISYPLSGYKAKQCIKFITQHTISEGFSRKWITHDWKQSAITQNYQGSLYPPGYFWDIWEALKIYNQKHLITANIQPRTHNIDTRKWSIIPWG